MTNLYYWPLKAFILIYFQLPIFSWSIFLWGPSRVFYFYFEPLRIVSKSLNRLPPKVIVVVILLIAGSNLSSYCNFEN